MQSVWGVQRATLSHGMNATFSHLELAFKHFPSAYYQRKELDALRSRYSLAIEKMN